MLSIPLSSSSLALALLVASGATSSYSEVEMFEPVQLDSNLSITAFGIVEDTRCKNAELCFENDRLIIAVLVDEAGERRGYEVEMGQPLQLRSGTLTLTGTSTPANGRWATDINQYRLDFSFQQY